MKKFVIIICFLAIISCRKNSKMEKLMISNNANDLIEAAFIMGDNKDTMYFDYLLTDMFDYRVGTNLRFKGISIYESKLGALQKISGKTPPHKITYIPDSANIKFYLELYRRGNVPD